MQTAKTANQIKSSFQLLASGHYQIHSFLYAQEFEQQAYENLIYPLMLVYPLGGALNDKIYTRNYRVIIADRVLKSEGNELEVESDTQLIALDVLAYWMKLGQNERFTITSSNTITPFWEKWGDEVTGHFVDIGIEEFYDFNSCAIPLSGAIPSPINPCKDARILINSVIYGNAPSDTNFNVVVKDQLGALVGSLIGGEWIVNTGGVCDDATYTIEDTLGNVLYTGTIPSGGNLNQEIDNSTLNVNKSDGTLISSRSILAEGTDGYNVADSLIENDATTPTYSQLVKATEGLILPTQSIQNNGVASGSILSVGTINVTTNVPPTSFNVTGRTINIVVPTAAPPSTGTFLVRFFDIDGTILKEERRNAGQDATAPTTPNYDPTYLVFAEWNQSFTNVQNDIDVGAIYDTIDGKTYLFLRITDTTGLQPTLQLNKSTTSLLTINWGDSTTNTSTTTGNQNITKTAAYAAIGDYVVTIEDTGLHGNTSALYILGNNTTYSRTLLKAYLGTNFRLYRGTFAACASLIVVSLVKNTVLDDRNTFDNCFSLIHVNIPALSGVINMLNFTNNHSLKTISFPPQFTNIAVGAFATCNSLYSIILTGVASFSGIQVFDSCNSLTKIKIPEGVTSLSLGLFNNCFSLNKAKVPSTITILNNSVFANNRSLTELEFGSLLTTIGTNVFLNCFSILEYTFLSTTPPTLGATNVFLGINAACKIYVPDASVAAYKAATNWSTYANYIYPLSTKP